MTRTNVRQRAIDASCHSCSVLMDAGNLIHHDKPITSSRARSLLLLPLLLFTLLQGNYISIYTHLYSKKKTKKKEYTKEHTLVGGSDYRIRKISYRVATVWWWLNWCQYVFRGAIIFSGHFFGSFQMGVTITIHLLLIKFCIVRQGWKRTLWYNCRRCKARSKQSTIESLYYNRKRRR